MSARLTLWLALSLGLWIWGGVSSQALTRPDAWMALLALGALLELTAVRLPGAGFASLGVAAYTGAFLWCGWGPAVVLAGVTLALRTLARGGAKLWIRLYEFLGDSLVVLPSLALAGRGGPGPGLVVYCFLSVYLGARMDPAHREDAAWARLVVVRAGAIGLAVAAWALPGTQAVALIPALFSLHLALLYLSSRGPMTEEAELNLELSLHKEELARSRAELNQARRALSEDQLLMAEMSKAIASTRDVSGALEQVLEVTARLVPARSLVIWLNQDDHLMAAAYRSPDGERLSGSALTGYVEPAVVVAWKNQRPTILTRVENHPEPVQAAYPIAGFGVLYAGQSEPFTGPEQGHLALVAEHSALALAAARRQESFQNELERLSRDHRRLQQSVLQLEALLEGSRKMALALEPKVILQLAMESARVLLGADRWLAILDSPVILEGELGDPAACRAVMETGKALLVSDRGESQFPSPLQGLRSWAAVPLAFESGPLGVLVAGSTQLPMSRRQLDLFSLLAYQAAAALTTLQLQQEVTQSSKLAAVGGLAAGVAHELNNPLGAVQLAIDLASESVDSSPKLARSSLEKASRALERSRQIVESLLLYTREQKSSDREPCQLNDLVGDVMEMLGPLLERAGIRGVLQLDPDLPRLSGNPQELRQAISNLVLNARDAVEEASLKQLQVSTYRDGPNVVVNVSDSGPGVDPAAASRIFEPFFTTKPVGKGTGLGLAITNRVAQRHGGGVQVDRSPLGGASFSLVLGPE